MKNEEMFELITQLKVDDEYIKEALLDEPGDGAEKIYAASARITPMRIIAPIAACLAVAVGAGVVLSNQSKLPVENNNGSEYSASTSQHSGTESINNSGTESADNNSAAYNSNYTWTFPSNNKDFVDKCKNIITSKFAQILPSDTTWQVENMDIDFDDLNELVLCPQVNGGSVKGVGVCVFRISPENEVAYLGSFGGNFGSMNLKNLNIVVDKQYNEYYYFNNNEENEKCVDSIQRLFFDKNTNTIQDQTYLRLIKTYPSDSSSDTPYTETAYHNGVEINIDEFREKWRNVWKNNDYMVVPQYNCSDAHGKASECVRLLVDKYNVPAEGNSLHRYIQTFDINNDGKPETVIEFKNCEQLRGIYIFSSDGKLIGEFDLEGTRGFTQLIGGVSNTPTVKLNTSLRMFYEGRDVVCIYTSSTGNSNAINKIVVNEDGTLSSEKEFECLNDKYGRKTYKINGEEVTEQKYNAASKYNFLLNSSIVW